MNAILHICLYGILTCVLCTCSLCASCVPFAYFVRILWYFHLPYWRTTQELWVIFNDRNCVCVYVHVGMSVRACIRYFRTKIHCVCA